MREGFEFYYIGDCLSTFSYLQIYYSSI